MAQDHGLCRKKGKESKWTGARAATAGPCCSCQRDSLAACKLLALTLQRILAHMEWTNGAKHNELNGAKQNKMNGANELVNGGKN